jgi:phospholipid/cholesterol/gamma-HCH transport system ATP-binding protein
MTGSGSAETMIELDGLHYSSAGRVIFAGLSLSVSRGRITAIMGPSGTGKTTILRMITGQLKPAAGRVTVAGQEVPRLNRADLFHLRRRMGMLFQNSALLTDYTVFENVAFPVREHTRLPERVIRTLVLTKLHSVGLRGAAGLMPSQLSGGMARRVALARAMVLDPDLILYDEPFSGLDPISMGMVLRLIKRNNEVLGVTSVVVSHDVEEINRIADYCYVVSGGSVVGAGTPADLGRSDSPMIRQFLTGESDGPVPFHYPAAPYAEELMGDP